VTDWKRASALATAAALMLLVAACGEGGAEKADAAPAANQTVTAATVAERELPRTVTASGTISPW